MEESGGVDPDDDEALWRLLGRARGAQVSPFFSRRVVRELARATEKGGVTGGVGGWLAGLRQALRRPRAAVWPGAVVVATFWVAVVATTSTHAPGRADHRSLPDVSAAGMQAAAGTAAADQEPVAPMVAAEDVAPQDVEVIADLDNMITREENRLWTEDTARF